jgi:hypothetical protein
VRQGQVLMIGMVVLAGETLALQPLQRRGENPNPVERLGWLAGCWQRNSGATVVDEQWMHPRAGMMLGVSRTVRADSVLEFEQLRIYTRGGRAIYAASPSGQSSAEFEARTTTDSLVVFENSTHDFPQRIMYRRHGADSLTARIEGTRGGKLRGVDFPYQRTSCP